MASNDYEVGYGKPPQHSRFRPGQSGNPNGRPTGSKNFTTVLRTMFNEEIVTLENGKPRKMTKGEALMRQQLAQAFKGDQRAAREMTSHYRSLDHLEHPDPDLSETTENDVEVLANLRRRLQGIPKADSECEGSK